MPGHTRFSRCSLVIVEVLTKIMQELIAHSQIKAPIVFNMIQGAKTFKDRLSKSDFITIQTLLIDDYSKLDITLVYKIAKFFHLIPQPTRNWGAKPLPHEQEIGDDVERIRRARNDLVHKIDCNCSEKEMKDFFSEFIEVGERVDKYLQKPIGSEFKVLIQSYQICSIDEDMEKKYTEIVKQMEQLKEKFRVKTDDKEVRIYCSKSLEDVIQDIRDLGSNHASSSTSVKIIINGIEDPEQKAQLLNSVKEEINKGAVDILFKSAHEGSLILYVDINNELFADYNRSAFEISVFIKKIFRIGELTFLPQDANGLIMTIDEDLFDKDDVQADDAESLYYNSRNLVLDIDVKNNVFLRDESMKTHLGGFVEKLMTKTNGSKIFQNPVTTAVMEPGEPVKDDNAKHAHSNQPFKRKAEERFKVWKIKFKLYVWATIALVTFCLLYALEIQTITYFLLAIVLFLLSVYATKHITWETIKSITTQVEILDEVWKIKFKLYVWATIALVTFCLLYALEIQTITYYLLAIVLYLLSVYATKHITWETIKSITTQVEILYKLWKESLSTTIVVVTCLMLYLLAIYAVVFIQLLPFYSPSKIVIVTVLLLGVLLVLLLVTLGFKRIRRHETGTQIAYTNFEVKIGDWRTPSLSNSDSDDSPVFIARDPWKDKYFDRKQKLLWNCKQIVGVSGQGKQPLTIAVIGPPGNGKSSFLNTVFAAFSNTHWQEYAKCDEFGSRDKQVTRKLKCFQKKDYYKDQDQYLMPTFLDITGFDDDVSPLNKELLNIVFCGKLKEGEELIDVIRYGNENGVKAVKDKYFGTTCFGLVPNRIVYRRVNRVIVVCSANPHLPIPFKLLGAVTEVINRERDIILYGVLSQTDRYKHSGVKVMEKEKHFMKVLGIPKTRFARIKNYCPDCIPYMSYGHTIVPSLDVPVLRLMRQVLVRDS